MPSWEEQAHVGPWWVAYKQEVNDAEGARLSGMHRSLLDIYWYAGGPFKNRELAEAARNELGRAAYVVLSCGQLQALTTPPPRITTLDIYFPTKQSTLQASRVQGFPGDCLFWAYTPAELERPAFQALQKTQDELERQLYGPEGRRKAAKELLMQQIMQQKILEQREERKPQITNQTIAVKAELDQDLQRYQVRELLENVKNNVWGTARPGHTLELNLDYGESIGGDWRLDIAYYTLNRTDRTKIGVHSITAGIGYFQREKALFIKSGVGSYGFQCNTLARISGEGHPADEIFLVSSSSAVQEFRKTINSIAVNLR